MDYLEKQRFDKQWRNYLENKEINGLKNPYLTNELIYKYHGFDIDREHYANYCLFNIFSLKQTEKKVDITYLNNHIEYLETQDRRKEFSKHTLKKGILLFYDSNSYISFTNWIENIDLSDQVFDLHQYLDDKPILKKGKHYNQYLRCINFVKDKNNFIHKYGLEFKQELKYPNNENVHNIHSEVTRIVYNPHTYTHMVLSKTDGEVYFYDVQKKYLVILEFGI